jgi:hypothetical protein
MKRHLLAGTDLTVSALCCGGADFGTAVMAPANERLATTFTAMAGYRLGRRLALAGLGRRRP